MVFGVVVCVERACRVVAGRCQVTAVVAAKQPSVPTEPSLWPAARDAAIVPSGPLDAYSAVASPVRRGLAESFVVYWIDSKSGDAIETAVSKA